MSKRPETKNLRMAIPEPYATLDSLYATVYALREAVQTLHAQRDESLGAVTYRDLVLLGVITESQIPKDGGFVRIVPLVSKVG